MYVYIYIYIYIIYIYTCLFRALKLCARATNPLHFAMVCVKCAHVAARCRVFPGHCDIFPRCDDPVCPVEAVNESPSRRRGTLKGVPRKGYF